MSFEIEYTRRFEGWWDDLTADEQDSVAYGVRLLQENGPALGRPHVDTLKGSVHDNMKELRVQHAGRPLRVLFAFDPRRTWLLLLGGGKTGDRNWYKQNLPVADALFTAHLKNTKKG